MNIPVLQIQCQEKTLEEDKIELIEAEDGGTCSARPPQVACN